MNKYNNKERENKINIAAKTGMLKLKKKTNKTRKEIYVNWLLSISVLMNKIYCNFKVMWSLHSNCLPRKHLACTSKDFYSIRLQIVFEFIVLFIYSFSCISVASFCWLYNTSIICEESTSYILQYIEIGSRLSTLI